MTKILICRLAMFENMGATALLMGLIRSLRNYMPNAEITLLGSKPEHKKFEQIFDIKLRWHPWNSGYQGWLGTAGSATLIFFDFCRCSLYRLARKLNKGIKTPYDQYDVIIDSNEDSLDESAYGARNVTLSLLQTFLEWAVFRRPMATTPTDIGTFVTRRNRLFARFVLNKLDIVALRDKESYDYCLQLGLNKPRVFLTGDTAFLLDPASQQRVRQILKEEGIVRGNKPFIGLCPNWVEMEVLGFSRTMSREERRQRYVKLMAGVTDYLTEKLNATVCLIPHVRSADMDDMEVAVRIHEAVKNKKAIGLLKGDYLPHEIKGVIGICDMLVGCRMHACIAATSMAVPTLAISYVDKFSRIIGGTMGQGEYIVDIRERSPDELLTELETKIELLWENRDRVKRTLEERTKAAQIQAMLYGKVIKALVSSKERSASVP